MDGHANDSTATIPPTSGVLGFDRLAQLLGGWQTRELQAVRGFPECRGLSPAQLEDLYQDTALALLSRPYTSEEHLRNALRQGIRHRALNMHRDQRRRRQILAEHAPAMHRTAEAAQTPPEDAALAQHDRLIAKEFLSELDPLERQVFALTAEGLRYRAIATALAIPVNQARAAARSCERKRARFQLLFETGRLCGYRAATIEALQSGNASGTLEQQARAHLAACQACGASRPPTPGERAHGLGVVVTMAAVLLVMWRWLRRLAGTGGIAAKASALAITAAVITGSALHTTSHPDRHGIRPSKVFASSPGWRSGTPTITGSPPMRVRRRRSLGGQAGRRATSARHTGSASVATAPILSIPGSASPSARATEPQPLAAQREFGPER